MMRIASLCPATTEIVCALGLRDALVGRSHACDYPADVAMVPIVSKPQDMHPCAPAGVDIDALLAVKPDLILTDDPAISLQMATNSPTALCLNPGTLEEVFGSILCIGDVTEKQGDSKAIVGNLRIRVDKVKQLWATALHNPTVAAIKWLEPLQFSSKWMPDVIACAGGQHVLGVVGHDPTRTSWDALIHGQPEMIVCMLCGLGVNEAVAQFIPQVGNADWRDVPATYLNQIICVNGNGPFGRASPRIVDGIEILAGLLHPNLLPHPSMLQAKRVQPFPLNVDFRNPGLPG